MTKTWAGVTVPAAVMSRGKNFGKELAASRTALYPATVLIALRASMGWARVIRGMSSMENEVILHAANAWISAVLVYGWRKLIRMASAFIFSTSTIVGGWTLRRMSALSKTSDSTRAPTSM